MDGLLLVNKPAGWTSFDVVAKIRGVVRKETGIKRSKVGHAGTLDPLATGLMLILVGKYCKRAEEFTKMDKVYDVELSLGETSTTGDEEGEKTQVSTQEPSPEEVINSVEQFIGEITQTPPAHSAIKIDGQRAYKLAREGKAVEMPTRKVTVHSVKDIKYDYPKVTFKADVSSGTYIRSLAQDIGEALSTGAYMSNLKRLSVGEYELTDACTVERAASDELGSLLRSVKS
jgi:tRNA pseudouridine55 synthase